MVVLIYISLVSNEIKHFICLYLVFEVSVKSSAMECRDGAFFLLICKSSIYFLDMSPLSDTCIINYIMNISPQSIVCLFFFLLVLFDEQYFLIMMISNLSLFFLFCLMLNIFTHTKVTETWSNVFLQCPITTIQCFSLALTFRSMIYLILIFI